MRIAKELGSVASHDTIGGFAVAMLTLVGETEGVLLGIARLLGLLKDVMLRCTLVRDRYRLSSDNTAVLVFLPIARLTAAH